MTNETPDMLALLRQNADDLLAEEPLALAGLKALRKPLATLLESETIVRTGEGEAIETYGETVRQLHNGLAILRGFYPAKYLSDFTDILEALTRQTRAILMLDARLNALAELPEETEAGLALLTRYGRKRGKALRELLKLLDSKAYRRWKRDFARWILDDSQITIPAENAIEPYQVRHVLPVIMAQALAIVRAHESLVDTIHNMDRASERALYDACATLADLVALFQPVLGAGTQDFHARLTATLRHLDDIATWRTLANRLGQPATSDEAITDTPVTQTVQRRREHFVTAWNRFNNRTNQRRLADALLIMR